MLKDSPDQAPPQTDNNPSSENGGKPTEDLLNTPGTAQAEVRKDDTCSENCLPSPKSRGEISAGEWGIIIVTFLLVLVTGWLAWRTGDLAKDTHRLVEGEHRNTVLSHRAWVAVIPGIASDLVWTDDDVRMKVAVVMTNFSNFPAMKVTVRPEMTLAKRCVPYTASDISTVLNEKRNMPEAELSGTYIFPGKENAITQYWDVSITNLEIEQWIQEQRRGQCGRMADELPITISIYVTYRSTIGEEVYMSSVSRVLMHKRVNGKEIPFTKKSGNVSMQDLELPFGENHID